MISYTLCKFNGEYYFSWKYRDSQGVKAFRSHPFEQSFEFWLIPLAALRVQISISFVLTTYVFKPLFTVTKREEKKKKTPSLSNIINTLLPREILHLNLWAIYIAYDPAMWRNTSCLMSMNKPTTLHIKLPLIFPTPNLQSLCTYIGKGSKSERL